MKNTRFSPFFHPAGHNWRFHAILNDLEGGKIGMISPPEVTTMTNDTIFNLITDINKNPEHEIQDQKNILYVRGSTPAAHCIGLVHILPDYDLHAYMLPEHRGKGIMKDFMQNVVIPYMKSVLERSEIIVSICSDEGLALVKAVGFEKLDMYGAKWVLR